MNRVWGCLRCGVATDTLNADGWCRDCVTVEAYIRRREKRALIYAADSERVRERQRLYRDANRELIRARNRKAA